MRGILQASMALLIMIGGADAAGADICAASVHPENFDRQRLTLEGIAAGLRKGTSHGGTKYMTFLLRSSAGCGSVFVYARCPRLCAMVTMSKSRGHSKDNIFETDLRSTTC